MTNPLEQIRELAEKCVVFQMYSTIGPLHGAGYTLACKEIGKEILAILDASQGYVCVPVEPTEAMINAGSQAGEWGSERDVWSAMLAASKETNRE